MKVVQINAVYGTGSTGRIAADIHQALQEAGHQAYVFWGTRCVPGNAGLNELVQIGTPLDHKIHAMLRRIGQNQAWHSKVATKKACKKLKEICPDVVHLHNLHSNYIHLPTLLKFLAKEKISTIVTLHDSWFMTGGCSYYQLHNCWQWKEHCRNCPAVPAVYRKKIARLYRQRRDLFEKIPNLVVNGVSQWTTEAAKESLLKTATRIECIYNGIDTDIFTPATGEKAVREKYGIPEHHKMILGVSQGWSERKGLKEFVSISKQLQETATVVLVGEGKNVPDLPNLKCIGFTSNRQDLIELYGAADLFVNPSRMETFGLVTVEAMSCGTPVVAYDNTGSSELVREDCGWLAEDGNLQDLLEKVTSALQDETLKTKGENGRKYAVENFNAKKQTQKYLDLYGRTLNG